MGGSHTEGLEGFLWTLGANLVVGIAIACFFSYLRQVPSFRKFYVPRIVYEEEHGKAGSTGSISALVSGTSYMSLSYEDLLPHIGIDGVAFLKHLDMMAEVFGQLAVTVAPLLMIAYAFSDDDEKEEELSWQAYISLSNVPQQSPFLYICVGSCLITTFYILYRLNLLNAEILALRRRVLVETMPNVSLYTVLVRDIPNVEQIKEQTEDDGSTYFSRALNSGYSYTKKALRVSYSVLTLRSVVPDGNATISAVKKFFADMHGGTEVKCVIVPPTDDLDLLVKRHNQLVGQIERIDTHYTMPDGADEGGAPEYSSADAEERQNMMTELDMLKTRINDCKEETLREVHSHCAFVKFPTIREAAITPQVAHTMDGKKWIMEPAPSSKDILWSNLKFRWWERWLRTQFVYVVAAVIILFFLVPITAVSGMSTLDNLEEAAPWLRPLTRVQHVEQLLTGLIPGLVLILALQLIPEVFRFICSLQGLPTHHETFLRASEMFFLLLVLDVFAGVSAVRSILAQLENLLSDFSVAEVVRALGESVPDTSYFFINYVMIRCGMTMPFELLRFGYVGFVYQFTGFFRETKREHLAAQQPPLLRFYRDIPNLLFVVLLGVVYSTIAPLMLPFACLCFHVAKAVWRHQLLFVYNNERDSRGHLWLHLLHGTVASLLVAQVTLIGVLILKYSPAALLVVPVIGTTVIFQIFIRRRTKKGFHHIPLDVCSALDKHWEHINDDGLISECFEEDYYPPALKKSSLQMVGHIHPSSSHDNLLHKRLSVLQEEGSPKSSNGTNGTKYGSIL